MNTTLLGLRKVPVLASRTCFGCHKLGWSSSDLKLSVLGLTADLLDSELSSFEKMDGLSWFFSCQHFILMKGLAEY